MDGDIAFSAAAQIVSQAQTITIYVRDRSMPRQRIFIGSLPSLRVVVFFRTHAHKVLRAQSLVRCDRIILQASPRHSYTVDSKVRIVSQLPSTVLDFKWLERPFRLRTCKVRASVSSTVYVFVLQLEDENCER